MRVLLEVLHIVIGVFAAMLIAALASWSYGQASRDIWLVAYVSMAAVVAMGIMPIRRAYEADRAAMKRGGNGADSDG